MALSLRQGRFVAAYLKTRDGKASAIAAGYSLKAAAAQASRMLRIPAIADALRKGDASIVKRVNSVEMLTRKEVNNAEVSAVRIVQEAAHLAFLDPADFYDLETGNLLPVPEMPERARRALAGMDVEEVFERDENGRMIPSGALLKKIKVSSKLGALEFLAKVNGMIQAPSSPAFVGPNFAINIHLGGD